MSASDLTLYPAPQQLRRANREFVAYVRSLFPRKFYGRNGRHLAFVGAALLRMCDTLDGLMALMSQPNDSVAPVLLRSLYEQGVRLCWVQINPRANHPKWVGHAQRELLTQHRELVHYGITLLTPSELASVQNAPTMPDVETMTRQVDAHWSGKIPGFYQRGHLLSFHGMYQGIYRTTSKVVHGSLNALEPYFDLSGSWPTAHESTESLMLSYALGAPVLGMALVVAAEDFSWIDNGRVRRFVDRATAETTRRAERRSAQGGDV